MSSPADEHRGLPSGGRGLAGGSLVVAVGLGVTGAATLAMISLVDHRLSNPAADAFNQWWLITTLLVTPFGVFEAYLARLVVVERAAGRDPSAVVATLLSRTWIVAGGLGFATLCLGAWLRSAEFGGHTWLVLLLPVWVFVLATQAVQRGVATGEGRFAAIAVQLAIDGLLRIGLTAGLSLGAHAGVDLLAGATCVSAASGIVAASRFCPGWYVAPALRGAGVSWRPILLLLLASAAPVLAGSGPGPWLNAVYHHHHQDTAIVFAAAVTLSRVPTQFVSAAFGPLLSHLTHAAETGDQETFRRLRRVADLGATCVGAAFVVGFAVLGGRLLAGYTRQSHAGALLHTSTLAVLAMASALMLLAVVQQATLAALDRWNTIAAAWGVALVALVALLVVPMSALWRATAAPAAAIGTALVIMVAASIRAAAAQTPPGR